MLFCTAVQTLNCLDMTAHCSVLQNYMNDFQSQWHRVSFVHPGQFKILQPCLVATRIFFMLQFLMQEYFGAPKNFMLRGVIFPVPPALHYYILIDHHNNLSVLYTVRNLKK